jgi:hypothetical protein
LLKAVDLELYKKMRSNTLTWSEASIFINRGNWQDSYGERLGKVIRWHLDPDIQESSDEWAGFYNDNLKYNLERLGTLRYIAISVVDRFASPDASSQSA